MIDARQQRADNVAELEGVLTVDERAQRARILAEGGRLATSLVRCESAVWPSGWLREVWLWVLWLVVVGGMRGPTTIARYAELLERFRGWVKGAGLDYADLELSDLDAWQKALWQTRRVNASTRGLHLQAVRSFYAWRRSRGLGPDVTHGMRRPKVYKTTPRKYSPSQLRALFAATAAVSRNEVLALRNRTLLLMLYATGARREELATLRIGQIELDGRVMVVRFAGKGAKEREVPCEGPVVEAIAHWLDFRRDVATADDSVFVRLACRNAGEPLGVWAIERIVKACAREARLAEWGVHRFRVTFATQLYEDGHDIERIRIVMGHESIETTRRYLSVSQRMRRVRLSGQRQHEALGTTGAGFPRWAKKLEEQGHA